MMVKVAAGGGGGGPGGFYRTVTIDHTKVGTTDQTDFPVTIAGTYTYLKTVANSGKVQNGSGFDVGFYSDVALTTKLKWEVVQWVATSGVVEYHVKVPTVSHSSDTVFYMNYGNTGISTDQSDKTNTWNAGFQLVDHMGDGTTLSTDDSTSNARNLNASAGTPTATAGKFGGGVNLASSTYYNALYNAESAPQWLEGAISFWVNKNANAATRGLFQWGNSDSTGTPFVLFQDDNGTLKFYVNGGYRESSQTLSTGTWYLVALTASNSGSAWKFYLNGSILSTFSGSVVPGLAAAVWMNSGFATSADAKYDEWRVSNVLRSGDWLLAEYNNQSMLDSGFYTIGAETGV